MKNKLFLSLKDRDTTSFYTLLTSNISFSPHEYSSVLEYCINNDKKDLIPIIFQHHSIQYDLDIHKMFISFIKKIIRKLLMIYYLISLEILMMIL